MISGNQTTRPNYMSSWTTDEPKAAVTVQELADYLGVAKTDPLLPGIALSATDALSAYLNVELTRREWFYKLDRYPTRQEAYTGLTPMPSLSEWWITLPKWPVRYVKSVTADKYEVDYQGGRVWVSGEDHPIMIEYTAGYSRHAHGHPEHALPATLKGAVLTLAAFVYEHRGACDVSDAGKQSGAYAAAGAYRRIVGGL